jgi:hypothetical protein
VTYLEGLCIEDYVLQTRLTWLQNRTLKCWRLEAESCWTGQESRGLEVIMSANKKGRSWQGLWSARRTALEAAVKLSDFEIQNQVLTICLMCTI